MAKIGGVNVAALTPRREGTQTIDLGAALELIDHLSDSGISGIALLGATGEFLNFDLEDRLRLIGLAVKRSRLPIIAGIAHTTLEGAVTLGLGAADHGATALLLLPPCFYRYSQQEIREFYLRFADEIRDNVPIFLYNVPMFTNEIACETALELLSSGLFAGIKESSGNWEYFLRLKALQDQKPFVLMVGNDRIFANARVADADGVISGVGCALPELILGIERAIQTGTEEKWKRLDSRLQEFISWLDRLPTPLGVKEASALRGLNTGAPSVPLSPGCEQTLSEFREWFGGWLPTILKECGGE